LRNRYGEDATEALQDKVRFAVTESHVLLSIFVDV